MFYTIKTILLKILSSVGSYLRNTPLGKSRVLHKVHAFLALGLHNSNLAKVGEFTVEFDKRDRFIAKKLVLYGGCETYEIDLFCSLVKEGDTVMDVGANIGLYTLPLSRKVGDSGTVIAVEPDPDNLRILRNNIERNKCNNVTILSCALSTTSEEAELFQVESNWGALTLHNFHNRNKSVTVQVKRGDEALRKLKIKPRLAKIDVEGFEPMVIEGFRKYLPPILFFEFVPAELNGIGKDPLEFIQSIMNKGYKLELIDTVTGRGFHKTGREIYEMTKVYNHNLRNVVATIPNQERNAFVQ